MADPADTADTAETTLDTPLGRLSLLAGPRGLRRVRFPGERTEAGPSAAGPVPGGGGAEEWLRIAVSQVREYFAGARTRFDLALDPVGTPFQLAAWGVLRTIPYGTTISYGEQGRRVGDARKARAVGGANGRNPIPIVVPCHRVIGSGGALVGFGGGTDAKAWLLDHERTVLCRRGGEP